MFREFSLLGGNQEKCSYKVAHRRAMAYRDEICPQKAWSVEGLYSFSQAELGV